MSPIRTKPFRTRSAGDITTKVLDGHARIFNSSRKSSNLQNIVAGPAVDAVLQVRFIRTVNFSQTGASTIDAEYGLGPLKSIKGSSTNQNSSSSSGYILVAVNKPCIVHYSITVSSENNYDWAYLQAGGPRAYGEYNSFFTYTSATVDLMSRISGSTTRTSTTTVESPTYTFAPADDGSEEFLVCARYTKDGSLNGGSDTMTVNNLYFTDIP